MINYLITPNEKGKLERFPIILEVHPDTVITNSILGAHENYVVFANKLEIARMIDIESAFEYVGFLQKTGFMCFTKTKQGKKILQILKQLYDNQKMTSDSKGDTIIRDINETKLD